MTGATRLRVSCIVPAYNEGGRIGAVLEVLIIHPLIDDIVVVDDYSTDDTAEIAARFARVTLIRQARNGGKTRALAAGLARTSGEVILLIDADLEGLDAPALTALLAPVLEGRADMSISLRRNAPRLWHLLGIDYISGERALRRALIERYLPQMEGLRGFAFEVWLNGLVIAARGRIAVVRWPRVQSPIKSRKRGLAQGILADAAMMSDIVRTVSPLRLVLQIAAMRRLRVR